MKDSTTGRHAAKLQEHLQRRLDERKVRQRKSASGSSKQNLLKFKQPNGRTVPMVPAPVYNKAIMNGSGAAGGGSNSKQTPVITVNTLG